MQTNTINDDELCELLTQGTTLAIIDDPATGLRQTVLDGGKTYGDLLIISGTGSRHLVIYPCKAFDHETGSIHDIARAMLA